MTQEDTIPPSIQKEIEARQAELRARIAPSKVHAETAKTLKKAAEKLAGDAAPAAPEDNEDAFKFYSGYDSLKVAPPEAPEG